LSLYWLSVHEQGWKKYEMGSLTFVVAVTALTMTWQVPYEYEVMEEVIMARKDTALTSQITGHKVLCHEC
jgi:hypothetical protein